MATSVALLVVLTTSTTAGGGAIDPFADGPAAPRFAPTVSSTLAPPRGGAGDIPPLAPTPDEHAPSSGPPPTVDPFAPPDTEPETPRPESGGNSSAERDGPRATKTSTRTGPRVDPTDPATASPGSDGPAAPAAPQAGETPATRGARIRRRPRSPWDAGPPDRGLAVAMFAGLSMHDSAADPAIGIALRWALGDAFNLRLEVQGYLPGARVSAHYTLLDAEHLTVALTAPFSFYLLSGTTYGGFAAGGVATLRLGPLSVTGGLDAGWYTYGGNRQLGDTASRSLIGYRPSASVDIGFGGLRVGVAVDGQVLADVDRIVTGVLFVAAQL